MAVQRMHTSHLESSRKILAGRKSIIEGTEVGKHGLVSALRKSSNLAGKEQCVEQ